MMVTYDTEADATYVQVADGRVATTVDVTDLVMVDLDAHGQLLGVEFAVSPRYVTDAMLYRLAEQFPELKKMAADHSWLFASA